MDTTPTDVAQDSKPDVLLNLDAFKPHLRAGNLSPNTVRSYADAVTKLDAYLADRGMPRVVVNIHREHVESFIADQLERFQPATAANRYRSLQQFFKWLVDEGEIETSPMVKMRPPRVDEESPDVLRPDAIDALREVTSGTTFDERRDRAIIELFYSTGMRRAELGGLKVDDIDQALRVAHVHGKGATRKGVASQKHRVSPFDDEAAKVLFRYILRARAHHPDAESPWLWLGKKGKLTDNGIAQLLNRRGLEAGLGRINPHRLRHTWAHELLAAGMQEGDLMRLAGWTSPAMPKRYGKSAANERAEAAYRALRDRRGR